MIYTDILTLINLNITQLIIDNQNAKSASFMLLFPKIEIPLLDKF